MAASSQWGLPSSSRRAHSQARPKAVALQGAVHRSATAQPLVHKGAPNTPNSSVGSAPTTRTLLAPARPARPISSSRSPGIAAAPAAISTPGSTSSGRQETAARASSPSAEAPKAVRRCRSPPETSRQSQTVTPMAGSRPSSTIEARRSAASSASIRFRAASSS